jgi:hypothetical protein
MLAKLRICLYIRQGIDKYIGIEYWLYIFLDMIIGTNILLNVPYIATVAINIGCQKEKEKCYT